MEWRGMGGKWMERDRTGTDEQGKVKKSEAVTSHTLLTLRPFGGNSDHLQRTKHTSLYLLTELDSFSGLSLLAVLKSTMQPTI